MNVQRKLLHERFKTSYRQLKHDLHNALLLAQTDPCAIALVDDVATSALRWLHQQLVEQIDLAVRQCSGQANTSALVVATTGSGHRQNCTAIYMPSEHRLIPTHEQTCIFISSLADNHLQKISEALNRLEICVRQGAPFSNQFPIQPCSTLLGSLSRSLAISSPFTWCIVCDGGGCFCQARKGLIITSHNKLMSDHIKLTFSPPLPYNRLITSDAQYRLYRETMHLAVPYRLLVSRFIDYWTGSQASLISGPYSMLNERLAYSKIVVVYPLDVWTKVVLGRIISTVPMEVQKLHDKPLPDLWMGHAHDWDVVDEALVVLSVLHGIGDEGDHPFEWFLDLINSNMWNGILNAGHADTFIEEFGHPNSWVLRDLEPIHKVCGVDVQKEWKFAVARLSRPVQVWAEVVMRIRLAAEAYKLSSAECAGRCLRSEWLEHSYSLLWQAAALSVRETGSASHGWKPILSALLCRAVHEMRRATNGWIVDASILFPHCENCGPQSTREELSSHWWNGCSSKTIPELENYAVDMVPEPSASVTHSVIDLGTNTLILLEPGTKYVAISHVWLQGQFVAGHPSSAYSKLRLWAKRKVTQRCG